MGLKILTPQTLIKNLRNWKTFEAVNVRQSAWVFEAEQDY